MNLSSVLFRSLMTVSLGAVLGFSAGSTQAVKPVETKIAGDLSATSLRTLQSCDPGGQSCCSETLSKTDELALLTHNAAVAQNAKQTGKKPNFVFLWGDDIGVHNISAYNHGIMGYRTPNIDRIAK